MAVRYKVATFQTLQNADLTDGTFPANAVRVAGTTTPVSVDLLKLDIETRMMTVTGSYGVTERLSVGGGIPLVSVTVKGQRARAEDGRSTLQSSQSGTSTGLGDIGMNARYRLIDRGPSGASVGADLRLPTGRQDDLLGAGKAAARILAIGSWEGGALGLHANGGIGVGGVSRELFWSGAATYGITPRLTVIGEVVDRYLSALTELAPIYEPSQTDASLEAMRWLPSERGLNTVFVVTGAKWNVTRNVLLNGNFLFRADDKGLRSRVTPTISLEFDFEP